MDALAEPVAHLGQAALHSPLALAEPVAPSGQYQKSPAVPARHAHPHCASVGSVNRLPVVRESHSQKCIACCQVMRATGWSGRLTGWPRSLAYLDDYPC